VRAVANRMLDRESVRTRLTSGETSFTEFSFQVLRALDFLELHRRPAGERGKQSVM
jgi:tyrosyl-tRNA synthetase